ncbi:MAG: glycosyltransferase family 39 protein [Hyphomicrobium sp.]
MTQGNMDRTIPARGVGLQPLYFLIALCLTQIAAWTLVPAYTYSALPLDVAENYAWGPHWFIGSYKHPALPSWLLELSRLLTGTTGWPAYLLSQLSIALTFFFVFVLGRREIGAERAIIATLLLPWIYYFGWHTPTFNHDIVQLPLWAGLSLATWRAVETHRTVWWLAVGAIGALVLYGKLSSGLVLLAAAVWIVFDGRGRQALAARGPWLGLALFLILITPIYFWLFGSEASPLNYAIERGGRQSKSQVEFAVIQLAIAAGVTLPVLLLGALERIWPSRATPAIHHPVVPRFKAFLLVMTCVPLASTIFVTAVAGTGVKLMWGVPMLTLTGLLAVVWLPDRWMQFSTGRLAALSCAFVVALALIHGAVTARDPNSSRRLKRASWPQAEISARMHGIFAAKTGKPLQIIAGRMDNWVPSLIAVSRGDVRDIYTAADRTLSPWVTPERQTKHGVLAVWEEPECGVPDELVALVAGRPIGFEDFVLSPTGRVFPLKIAYVIVDDTAEAPSSAHPLLPPLALVQ